MTEEPWELEKKYLEIFQELPVPGSFQHDRRKREWFGVRLLTAGLIGPDFSILYSPMGVPQFVHPEFKYISISHSAAYVAVYLHKSRKVGLDVESLNRKFSVVEKKYLSEEELEQVRENPLLRAVFWGVKEAVYKWAGKEGVDFRKQIRIQKIKPESINTIHAVLHTREEYPVQLNYLLFDGHVLVYTS
jgi:phosphopantetheinyl transferase